MVKAEWNGKVIAESTSTIVVEGNHYFPAESINQAFFSSSTYKSACPWKGSASYANIQVDGKSNDNAAWFYEKPLPEAEKLGIKGHYAFWKGVKVTA